eukprot:1157313-Pelagomonas_calceolata.AAC.6
MCTLQWCGAALLASRRRGSSSCAVLLGHRRAGGELCACSACELRTLVDHHVGEGYPGKDDPKNSHMNFSWYPGLPLRYQRSWRVLTVVEGPCEGRGHQCELQVEYIAV